MFINITSIKYIYIIFRTRAKYYLQGRSRILKEANQYEEGHRILKEANHDEESRSSPDLGEAKNLEGRPGVCKKNCGRSSIPEISQMGK